ncbi:unnamed protein product [Gadus morhua 'NCC']
MNIHLRDKYSGVSSARVKETLDRSRRYQLHKASFRNKPAPKPIITKAVQDRHQVDLVDMGEWRVKYGRVTYRNVSYATPKHHLKVPGHHLKVSFLLPQWWNDIPGPIRSAPSLDTNI